jgi:uncharacterized membrane protein YagU involved in acid resistance
MSQARTAEPRVFAIGGVAGLFATAPMTLVLELLRDRLPWHQQTLPPHRITMRVLGRIGQRHRLPRREQRLGATFAAHFGYGAAMGSLYAPLQAKLPGPGLVTGLGFGLVVWLVSYLGVLPALSLFPPPQRDAPRRTALMIAGHVVWGATLGLLTPVLAERFRQQTQG